MFYFKIIQGNKNLGDIRVLPDSSFTIYIMNTSSARKLGMKTISKLRGSYEPVKTATNESVTID